MTEAQLWRHRASQLRLLTLAYFVANGLSRDGAAGRALISILLNPWADTAEPDLVSLDSDMLQFRIEEVERWQLAAESARETILGRERHRRATESLG